MTRGRHRIIERSRQGARRLARRSRARGRRFALAVWIRVSLVAVLVTAGSIVGYAQLIGARCDGPLLNATVVASPDQVDVLSEVAQSWQQTAPAVDDRCVGVTVEGKDPSETAAALGPSWDQRHDGPRPDVWVPDSLAWMLVAANRPEAAAMLPAKSQSLASSPVVIAVPKPMAEALGWPDRPIGWRDLVSSAVRGQNWATFGHPEWGPLRVGMTDPVRSTAGLTALVTVADIDNNREVSARELAGSRAFAGTVADSPADTARLLEQLADAGNRGTGLGYLSAFPALERDVHLYNTAEPRVPLVAVYPRHGTAYADYPYAVLKAPWVDQTRRRIAGEFLEYLRGTTGRQAYGNAGFRDADRSARLAPGLRDGGFPSRVPSAARGLVTPASMLRVLAQWATLRRPATVLTVLDTSTSARAAPGMDVARLEVVRQAAATAIGVLGENTRFGLWEIPTRSGGRGDHGELVPTGPLGAEVGGVPRRQAVTRAIDGLRVGAAPDRGAGAFYDAVHAAFREAQRNWQPNQPNRVLFVTDGSAKADGGGLTRAALVDRLRREQRQDRPVEILVVTDAADADVAGLQEISRVTGGRTFAAARPEHLENVLFAALFAP